MADLEARFDTSALDRLGAKAEPILFRNLQGAFNAILWGFNARHIKERMTGRPGVARRTGQLARSWKVVVRGDRSDTLHGLYGTTSRYAAMQEFGGVQKPSRAKMLAIPLPAARTAAGVSRYHTPLRATLAANFPGGVFVARSKAGNLILFGKPSKDADPVALFILKLSVRIPPRLGTRDLWRAFLPQAQGILTGFVRQANVELAQASRGGA